QGGERSDERAIERSLNAVSDRLQSAEQSARGPNGSSAEENLDRTRQLADNLDSLRRRLDENAARKNGKQTGQQGNQQQGQQGENGQQSQQNGQQGQGQRDQQQQGQQGQQGQQSGQQQGQQQAGGSQNGGQSSGDRQRMNAGPQWGPIGSEWGDNRQLPAEVRERLREAQDLRRDWGGTSTGSARQLDTVIDKLKQLADGRMEGDAATASLLKQEVVEPLRQLELELSRQIQQQSGRTNLRLRDEGAAPEKYRRAVEEYYRRLSG